MGSSEMLVVILSGRPRQLFVWERWPGRNRLLLANVLECWRGGIMDGGYLGRYKVSTGD